MKRRARRELLAAVAHLDDNFVARTQHDPFSPPTYPWWKRRLDE
ncbi:MAG TPA: hypothetical protein VLH10_10615 [Yinghuangia sp.]|nr:hypothetical protein [Yinghuangia sp.]